MSGIILKAITSVKLIARISALLTTIFLWNESLCQEWIRVYGQGQNAVSRYIIDDYDYGFVILGMINYKYLWIIKTDVNGYMLWDKKIGEGNYTVWSRNIEKTLDNGYIICGTWAKFNLSFDAFLIKLNSCFEIEWCKTIITPTNYDMGIRVKPTPEGDFVLLGAYFATSPVSNVSLFKFNSSGELIWHQFYPLDSLYYDDQPTDLVMDNDGYLIVTRRHYPDPGQTGGGTLRSNYIKTDTAGNELWNTVYVDSGYYYSRPWASTKNQYGHYYTSCTHTIYSSGDNPAIIKVMHNGDQSYNQDILNTGTFNLSGMGTIDFLHDTNFVMFGGWMISGNESNVVIKTDTLGTLRKTKEMPQITNSFISTAKTNDNKFISIANDATGGSWKIYAVKVNSDLEYDSIYNQPFVYDSLCPYPIVSDTVDPDCDNVYVGIEEPFKNPETTQLKVYPNPATDRITVGMPKYLVVENKSGSIPSTTVYHQWKGVILEAYDLRGNKVFEKEVIRAETEIGIDISGWRKGLYIFRLVYNDREVSNVKVVVR